MASDVLRTDPVLDYINDILMEEGMDDATCMQQVDPVSYRAVVSGFYEVLGECLPPNPPADPPRRVSVFHPHPVHQHASCSSENGPDEPDHVKVVSPNDGMNVQLHILGAPRVSLPANGSTLKHVSSFQGHSMGSNTPLKSEMENGISISGSHSSSHGLREASASLSSSKDFVAAPNCHNAIKLNDGELQVAMVSSWGKGAPVSCTAGQEQGTADSKLPPADEEFSLKLPEVELSFEDLKLNDLYTDLYVGEPCSSGSSARDSKHVGDKREFLSAGKGSKFSKKSTSEVHVFLDTKEVLVNCANAVAIGDARRASELLQELHQVHGASANGTGLQRIAFFFSKALAARMSGVGEHHFRAITHNMPSAATLLWATKFGFAVSPFVQLTHYFANQSILKAAEGASRLHVVDVGLQYGLQWPCLINALADRKGGPPLLVITGIEFPQPGPNPAEKLEESGRRLAAYAKTYNVPLQFHAIATYKWQDIDAASLHLHKGEVLVVNCIKRLRHLADDSGDLTWTPSPRQKFLTCMRSLNPHLLITAVLNAAYNSPFFVSRFRDALYYYSNLFDMLDILWGENPHRLILECSYFYRDIVNIVACEGAERVERPETYKQWEARITTAGFQQLPIPPAILCRSRSHVMQHHHKDFLIQDDAKGWMLMGWKGRTTQAISAWKPRPV